MTAPCDLPLLEAAAKLESRELSPIELLQSALARLRQTEPELHAFVVVDEDRALETARRAEAEIAAGDYRGPLHGIPMAIKDIFDQEGLPTRCGSRVRENAAPASEDAEAVARARRAGAVFIGKTVTQEFAAGVISVPARNPWDPSRIPGGSSGGSGASVAVGSSLVAFGSDTGGSIRNPAAINGVVGLKPTYGTVSTRGVYPLAWSLDTVGPLARTVADAATVYNLIADDARNPDATSEIGLDLHGMRLGVLRPYFFDRLQPDVAQAVEAAIGVFRDLGAEVIETPWKQAQIARAASFVINRVETVAVHRNTIREAPELLAEELRLRIESNALYPATGYVRAHRARAIAKHSIARLFHEHRLDTVLAPVSGGTAAPADDLNIAYQDGTSESVHLAYTRLTMPFNATGQPALSVPCGFDRNGLPIGLQIAGRPYAEARLCRIGHAYEQAAGWACRRPPIIVS